MLSAASIISTYFFLTTFFGATFFKILGTAFTVAFLALVDFLEEGKATFLNYGSFSARASRIAPPFSNTLSSTFYSACNAEYSMISWSTISSLSTPPLFYCFSYASTSNSTKLSVAGLAATLTASTIMISTAIARSPPPYRIYITYRFIFNEILYIN